LMSSVLNRDVAWVGKIRTTGAGSPTLGAPFDQLALLLQKGPPLTPNPVQVWAASNRRSSKASRAGRQVPRPSTGRERRGCPGKRFRKWKNTVRLLRGTEAGGSRPARRNAILQVTSRRFKHVGENKQESWGVDCRSCRCFGICGLC